jgi:hypothetical protein
MGGSIRTFYILAHPDIYCHNLHMKRLVPILLLTLVVLMGIWFARLAL